MLAGLYVGYVIVLAKMKPRSRRRCRRQSGSVPLPPVVAALAQRGRATPSPGSRGAPGRRAVRSHAPHGRGPVLRLAASGARDRRAAARVDVDAPRTTPRRRVDTAGLRVRIRRRCVGVADGLAEPPLGRPRGAAARHGTRRAAARSGGEPPSRRRAGGRRAAGGAAPRCPRTRREGRRPPAPRGAGERLPTPTWFWIILGDPRAASRSLIMLRS